MVTHGGACGVTYTSEMEKSSHSLCPRNTGNPASSHICRGGVGQPRIPQLAPACSGILSQTTGPLCLSHRVLYGTHPPAKPAVQPLCSPHSLFTFLFCFVFGQRGSPILSLLEGMTKQLCPDSLTPLGFAPRAAIFAAKCTQMGKKTVRLASKWPPFCLSWAILFCF